MRQVFFLLLILLGQLIYSQENLLTEKENIEWISEFKKLSPTSEKIKEIRKKIYIDSNYISKDALNKVGDKILLFSNDKMATWSLKKNEADCKITFILALKDGDSYYLDPVEYSNTVKILNIINDRNIDNINILERKTALTLYGTYGKCGTVVLYSKNRKLKKMISSF